METDSSTTMVSWWFWRRLVLMKEFDTAVVELISSWCFLGGAIGVDERD